MKRAPVPHPYRDFEVAGWERAAAAYADTFESATRLFADPLLDAVDLNPGANLLDNACGSGYVTQLAFERGATVTGADFSAAMLAERAACTRWSGSSRPMLSPCHAQINLSTRSLSTLAFIISHFRSRPFWRRVAYFARAAASPSRSGQRLTNMLCRASPLKLSATLATSAQVSRRRLTVALTRLRPASHYFRVQVSHQSSNSAGWNDAHCGSAR